MGTAQNHTVPCVHREQSRRVEVQVFLLLQGICRNATSSDVRVGGRTVISVSPRLTHSRLIFTYFIRLNSDRKSRTRPQCYTHLPTKIKVAQMETVRPMASKSRSSTPKNSQKKGCSSTQKNARIRKFERTVKHTQRETPPRIKLRFDTRTTETRADLAKMKTRAYVWVGTNRSNPNN